MKCEREVYSYLYKKYSTKIYFVLAVILYCQRNVVCNVFVVLLYST